MNIRSNKPATLLATLAAAAILAVIASQVRAQLVLTPSNAPSCATTELVRNTSCGPELDIINRLVVPYIAAGQAAYFAAFEPAGAGAWRLSVTGPVSRIARTPPVPYVHEHFAWLCPAQGRLYLTAVFNPNLLQRAVVLVRDAVDTTLWRYQPAAPYPARPLACD